MKILIRTDSSTVLGGGHVVRCIALAEELQKWGAEVQFVCRPLPGDASKYVRARGFTWLEHKRQEAVQEDALHAPDEGWDTHLQRIDAAQTMEAIRARHGSVDWVVVDHYGCSAIWETAMRRIGQRILVIDDLANRTHDADVLVDPNAHQSLHAQYSTLVSEHCKLLLGSEFSLLRPEFIEAHMCSSRRDGSVHRILVSFGWADTAGLVGKVLAAVGSLNRNDIQFDVVVGHASQLAAHSKGDGLTNIRFHYDTRHMADLMVQADLAIGACGASTWERCCVGLPALVVSVTEHQIGLALEAQKLGVVKYLGTSDEVSPPDLAQAIREAIKSPDALVDMGRKGAALVDGRGAERVSMTMRDGASPKRGE